MHASIQQSEPIAISEPKRPREISGRWVVVGMFVFGILATGTMWAYWKLHVAPFLPLQEALVEAFPGSRPRVEGGQRKVHKGTPRILRITMKVEFDPTSQANATSVEQLADRVAALARDVQHDLGRYEALEMHFYWPEPEQQIKQGVIVRPVDL